MCARARCSSHLTRCSSMPLSTRPVPPSTLPRPQSTLPRWPQTPRRHSVRRTSSRTMNISWPRTRWPRQRHSSPTPRQPWWPPRRTSPIPWWHRPATALSALSPTARARLQAPRRCSPWPPSARTRRYMHISRSPRKTFSTCRATVRAALMPPSRQCLPWSCVSTTAPSIPSRVRWPPSRVSSTTRPAHRACVPSSPILTVCSVRAAQARSSCPMSRRMPS